MPSPEEPLMKNLLALVLACAWAATGLAQDAQRGGTDSSGSSKSDDSRFRFQRSLHAPEDSSTRRGSPSNFPKGPASYQKRTGPGYLDPRGRIYSASRTVQPQGRPCMSQDGVERIRLLMTRRSLSDNQQGALNRLQSDQNLTSDDRTALTNLLANDPNLDRETRDVIRKGLQDDQESKRRSGSPQTDRFLKIKNETNETLTVFFQYRQQSGDKWFWLPADPKKSSEAISLQIPPGKEVYAEVERQRVFSSRVRLWAKSTSSGTEWLEYKDQDLWLVPEVDKEKPKEHIYFAPNVETFTFTFKS
jgi:hypothetical protein